MSIKKNMLSNFLLTSSKFIFPLITFPYITRTLSTDSLGSVLFIDSFTQYFIILSAIGIPLYGVREIGKLKDDGIARSKLVIELITLQILLSVLFSVIFIAASFYVPKLGQNQELVKIGCISIISSSFLIEWFYQGIEKYTYITTRSLFVKIISIFCIISLIKSPDDNSIYYFILTLSATLNAIINFYYYFKKHHQKSPERLNIKKHIRPLAILFLINISVSIYTVADTIILGFLTNTENVSLYNVPFKLAKIYSALVLGLGFVLIPKISGLYKENNTHEIMKLMSKSFNIVFLLTIPFCFFCLIFPKEILSAISGSQYTQAANALRIFSFIPLIIGICNIAGTQFLLPAGREKKILQATTLGLIISISLNFALVPQFKYMASAYACLTAEIVVCLYILITAIKMIKITIDFRLITHLIISLGISIIPLFFFNIHSLYMLFICFFLFILFFLILQHFYFKNAFVFSIIKIPYNKKHG